MDKVTASAAAAVETVAGSAQRTRRAVRVDGCSEPPHSHWLDAPRGRNRAVMLSGEF